MLEAGKLYLSDHCLLLYSSLGDANFAHTHVFSGPQISTSCLTTYQAEVIADHWTKRLRKPVSYVDKRFPILVLKTVDKLHEVLVEDRKGWIIQQYWVRFEELTDTRSRKNL